MVKSLQDKKVLNYIKALGLTHQSVIHKIKIEKLDFHEN